MTLGDIAFTVTVLALGVANFYAARSYFRQRKITADARAKLQREETATALRNARRAGYLQGANNTMTVWGAHVRAIQGVDLHGFAEDCRKCGLITLNLIPADEEYWACKSCQHRNPAPLPPRLRSQTETTPNPDPANHDDA